MTPEFPDETFTVTLTNATTGATITDATAVGTITNDDGIWIEYSRCEYGRGCA